MRLGPLGEPDANGVRLPEGFTSRILATTGEVVAGTGYAWPVSPDGGAVFPQDDGGWVYTSNCEDPVVGGAAMIRSTPTARSSPPAGSARGPSSTAPAGRPRGAPG